jgi:predicted protein tyrosine phosphatase
MNYKTPFYLFVCFENQDRSPFAAAVCRKMARERGLEIKVSSAGISSNAITRITNELVEDADKIFVMEEYMGRKIIKEYGQNPKKIVCWDIDDEYEPTGKTWIEDIRGRLDEFLQPA